MEMPQTKTMEAKRQGLMVCGRHSDYAPEALRANGDDLAVRQRVLLFDIGACSRALHFCRAVERYVAQTFLEIANDFLFGSGCEGISALRHKLRHVGSEVSACEIEAADGMGHAVAFVNRHLQCCWKEAWRATLAEVGEDDSGDVVASQRWRL